jgi:hypothetical protein
MTPYITSSDSSHFNGNIRFLLEMIRARVKYLYRNIGDESKEENVSRRQYASRSSTLVEAREKRLLEGVIALYEYFSTGRKSLVKVLFVIFFGIYIHMYMYMYCIIQFLF